MKELNRTEIAVIAILAVILIIGVNKVFNTILEFLGLKDPKKIADWGNPGFMTLGKIAATNPERFLSLQTDFVARENAKLAKGQNKSKATWKARYTPPEHRDRSEVWPVAAKAIYDAVGYIVDSPEKLQQAQSNLQDLQDVAGVVLYMRRKYGKDLYPWLLEKMDTDKQRAALNTFLGYIDGLPTGAHQIADRADGTRGQTAYQNAQGYIVKS